MTLDTPLVFGVMKGVVLAIALGYIAGCAADGTPNAKAQQVIDVACNTDALVQPVMVPVVVASAPGTAPAAATDTLLVHPAVVAACAQYHSKPAALAQPAPAGVIVTAPVTVTP